MTKSRSVALRNRICSFVSAAIIALNSIPFVNLTNANAANSATNSGSVFFPDVEGGSNESAKLYHDDSLVDNGDGTFTFTSKITSAYSYSDYSESRLNSKDGEYILDKEGKYLIEVWGGDGGDGSRSLLTGRNGVGGKGGFVYGILDVSEENELLGKKLVYEIGSKGESSTFQVDGGGTGGIGGGAGQITFISIGAGGGYSAVYLLNSDPGTENDENLDPADMRSPDNLRDNPGKVLMIAGGGGGGAAGGNGVHFYELFMKAKGDGGDGGSKESAIQATPGIGAFKTGTYYSGADGTSAGGNTRYVGHGGTDKPGEATHDALNIIKGESPNDWQRLYIEDGDRGAGSAGNLRGAGGGAGFAGGSGGLQNAMVDANNVGGGGGGSSYTAAMANFTPYADLTDEQKPYFVKQEDNIYADVGGAVVIRYLPDDADYGYLNNVNIKGTVSDYFTIESKSCTDKDGNNITVNQSGEGNRTIDFTGSIAPVSSGIAKGQADDSMTLKLVLKPKTNFMGGNKVPIFANEGVFSCKTMVPSFYENNDINSTTDKNRDFTYGENVRFVNIPFKYKAGAVSKTISIDTPYDESDIIDSTVTNTLDANFANSVSSQYVAEVDETNKITDFSVADYNTKGLHKFDVVVAVVPKFDGADYVGTANPNPTYIRARSVIEIVDGEPLDGFNVKASKSLDYSSGGYNLSVNMDIDYNDIEVFKTFVGSSTVTDYPNTTQSEFGTEYTGTLDKGYYFIDIYGADGGNSGHYTGMKVFGMATVYDPNVGGNGAHKTGYIKIDNNNTPLKITVGSKGAQGNDHTYAEYTALGADRGSIYQDGWGTDGGDSQIIIGEESSPILSLLCSGGTGGKPQNHVGFLAIFGDVDADGYPGDDGTVTESGSKTLSSTLSVDGINNAHTDLSRTANVNTNNATIEDGCIRITKLAVSYGILDEDGNITYFDNVNDLNTEISSRATTFKGYLTDGFTVEETYSEYFTFDSATGNNCTLEEVTPTEDSKIKYKLKLSSETANTLSVNTEAYSGEPLILHEDVNNPSATITSYKYNFNALNVGINAKYLPVDNLVGGNDIPLLAVKTLAEINDYTGGNDAYMAETENTEVNIYHTGTTSETTDDDRLYLKRNDATDWANVAIKESFLTVSAPDDPIIIDCGDPNEPDLSSAVAFVGKNDNSNIYTFVDTESDTAPSGAVTEDCKRTVIGTIKPKTAAAKAVKIPSVSAVSKPAEADIKVRYSVTKELTNGVEQQGSVQYISGEADPTDIAADENEAILAATEDKLTLSKIQDAYVLRLVADSDHELPDATDVKVYYGSDPEDKAEADVTKSGGVITVTIPRSSFTDNITIEAAGVAKKEYKVHYWYEYYDPETPNMLQTAEFVDAGTPHYHISDPVVDHTGTLAPNHEDYPPWGGYVDYCWEWSDGVTSGSHTIVDGDIYVIGKFVKRNIPLTITYQYENGSPAATTYSAPLEGYNTTVYNEAEDKYYFYLAAGDAYSVRSPDVDGYVPDKAVVAGIAPENGPIEVTVTYSPNTDPANTEVIVNYVKCDGDGIPILQSDTRRETYTGVKDGEGNFDLERSGNNVVNNKVTELLSNGQIIRRTKLDNNKEIDVDSISGKLEAGEKAEFYVYYREIPTMVDVVFHKVDEYNVNAEDRPDEANITIGMTSRKVVPTREYGYDPEQNKYVGLPSAECSVSGEGANDWFVNGWRFVGWYDENDNPVDETTIVPNGIDPINLFAHWQPLKVTITIDYRYACNVKTEVLRDTEVSKADLGIDANPKTLVKAYGMVYKVESPPLTGYTPDPDFVKGEALTSKTETVYYKDKVEAAPEKTLRIDVYSSSYEGNNGALVTGAKKLIGGTFRLYNEEGDPIGEAQYNEDGSVSWSSIQVKLTENAPYTVVCIDPPTGYGCTSKQITFETVEGSNECVVNIFLDKSPFQLPMAGGKPLTGYTVCGISTMLLAAFLLFLYVSSKSEENENE